MVECVEGRVDGVLQMYGEALQNNKWVLKMEVSIALDILEPPRNQWLIIQSVGKRTWRWVRT